MKYKADLPPKSTRICYLCHEQIKRGHKHFFDGSQIRHRNCIDPGTYSRLIENETPGDSTVKIVVRTVIYEGDSAWVDWILSKSLPVKKMECGVGRSIEIRQANAPQTIEEFQTQRQKDCELANQ